eukprot:NODE_31796_length_389_cov_2.419847.p3 GENE.NODE_31796_length_389_cov_2.419847~~NODE_31796_length_389_cov_2.419847.p3  ORF type:complete len:67 (-),score=5.79 NODE_31796_length_389_cov_2.419847:82-282(-)
MPHTRRELARGLTLQRSAAQRSTCATSARAACARSTHTCPLPESTIDHAARQNKNMLCEPIIITAA